MSSETDEISNTTPGYQIWMTEGQHNQQHNGRQSIIMVKGYPWHLIGKVI